MLTQQDTIMIHALQKTSTDIAFGRLLNLLIVINDATPRQRERAVHATADEALVASAAFRSLERLAHCRDYEIQQSDEAGLDMLARDADELSVDSLRAALHVCRPGVLAERLRDLVWNWDEKARVPLKAGVNKRIM